MVRSLADRTFQLRFGGALQVLKIFRLMRLLRAVRLIAQFRVLWQIVQGLVSCFEIIYVFSYSELERMFLTFNLFSNFF